MLRIPKLELPIGISKLELPNVRDEASTSSPRWLYQHQHHHPVVNPANLNIPLMPTYHLLTLDIPAATSSKLRIAGLVMSAPWWWTQLSERHFAALFAPEDPGSSAALTARSRFFSKPTSSGTKCLHHQICMNGTYYGHQLVSVSLVQRHYYY